MADAGLPGFYLQCRSLDAGQMIEQFGQLERAAESLRQTIAERNAVKAALVRKQLAAMCAAIFPG
jgi:hypothetical protein